ncbi:NAD(P)-dependent alcohol dehydrogenase [Nocardioides lentus]|uniref:NAD(P)-dependent alcohol dehydrogenase n=1 Tax=Nocardioides lentus TaxID=338077 RepID=A0ABP5AKH9_9ACTN
MRITAAVVPGEGQPLEMRELELDDPRPGEVRVRLRASGICHTDAIVRDQWYDVPLPAVLGHEGAGVVEAVGDGVTTVAVGDHVVMSFASCGTCRLCLTGHPAYCATFYELNFGGRRTDGSTAFTGGDGEAVSSHFFGQSSFATHANVYERCLVTVPASAPLELLAPLGCGIQTGAGAVLNRLDPPAGSSVVVFGAGAVGLAAVLAAVVADATTIVAVDVVGSRLALARELGATHTVDPREEDAVERIREITGGGADFALDTTGVPTVFRQLSDCLGVLGQGAMVGATTPGTEGTVDIGTTLLSGQTLHMVIEGDSVPQSFIPRLIDLYEQGRFPFDRLVRTYDFDAINDGFADSESGEVLKPVVVFAD